MKTKRTLAMLLCICTAFLTLTACSSDDSGSTETTAPQADDTSAQTTAEANYLEKLGTLDLKGAEIRFAAHHGTSNRQNFPGDSEDGEPVNDAMYKRNLEVETMYNCKFVNTATDAPDALKTLTLNAVLAGDDTFDIIFADMNSTAKNLMLNGALVCYDDIPHVDLSQQWWNKYNSTDLALGGKIYFPTGVISPMYFKAAYGMMFNKRLADSLGTGDIYGTVYDGSWTIDKMASMMKDASSDINGDGKMDLSDRYALVYDEVAGFAFYIGTGLKMVDFDKDGMPYLVMGSDKSVSTIDKLRSIVGDKSTCLRGEDYEKNAEFNVFAEGRALFAGQTLVRVSEYRDMEDDFGLIPMPKLNETQDEYYSYAQPWSGTSVAIPVTNTKLDATGMIVEAMAYLSDDYIRTAMYEVTYKAKLARDEHSEKMLDIITETASFDLNVIFSWGSSANILRDNVMGNKENFASEFAAVEEAANTQLAQLKETLNSLK